MAYDCTLGCARMGKVALVRNKNASVMRAHTTWKNIPNRSDRKLYVPTHIYTYKRGTGELFRGTKRAGDLYLLNVDLPASGD